MSSVHTWNALIVGFEVLERARARISENVGAGQNAAISLLIASMHNHEKGKKEREKKKSKVRNK